MTLSSEDDRDLWTSKLSLIRFDSIACRIFNALSKNFFSPVDWYASDNPIIDKEFQDVKTFLSVIGFFLSFFDFLKISNDSKIFEFKVLAEILYFFVKKSSSFSFFNTYLLSSHNPFLFTLK